MATGIDLALSSVFDTMCRLYTSLSKVGWEVCLTSVHVSRVAPNVVQLHQRGLIPIEAVLLFGISGDLPEQTHYSQLTNNEKLAFWEDRLEGRLGPNWRRHFNDLPTFFRRKEKHHWQSQGF
jgi:hypothetical protein